MKFNIKNKTNWCIIVSVLILFSSCKKDVFTDDANVTESITVLQQPYGLNNTFYQLAINKNTGETILLESTSKPDFYLYNGDMLIHKNELQFIKSYISLNDKNMREIALLSEENRNNKYKSRIYAKSENRCLQFDNTCYNVLKGKKIWEGNKVVFSINVAATTPKLYRDIFRAIKIWTDRTHIEFKFVPWSGVGYPHNKPLTKIDVQPDNQYRCFSTIGQPDGPTGLILLGKNCSVQAIAHEIGHALGFTHEHQRPSRDNYIKINPNALRLIKENFSYYMTMMNSEFFDTTEIYNDSFQFDIKSFMMSPSYGPTIGEVVPSNIIRSFLLRHNAPLYTVRTSPGKWEIVNAKQKLSDLDIMRVNLVYPEESSVCH